MEKQVEEHVMQYRAGIKFGLLASAPGWYCTCGHFGYRAQAMPRRVSGNNLIEAQRAFKAHRTAE